MSGFWLVICVSASAQNNEHLEGPYRIAQLVYTLVTYQEDGVTCDAGGFSLGLRWGLPEQISVGIRFQMPSPEILLNRPLSYRGDYLSIAGKSAAVVLMVTVFGHIQR